MAATKKGKIDRVVLKWLWIAYAAYLKKNTACRLFNGVKPC